MSDYAGDISPRQAWEILQSDPKAVLVDVRTPPEWAYVGQPDLSSAGKQPINLQWQVFPAMNVNPQFAETLKAQGVTPDNKLLFLCRSGVRSLAAAQLMAAQGFAASYNIAGGFEGPHDANRHRGTTAGWKADGLPWNQS
jgi:rhodanese-related sulfurtransferase